MYNFNPPWIRENPKIISNFWYMFYNHSTLGEKKQFKDIIKSPKLQWHSCLWWVCATFWPQLYFLQMKTKKCFPFVGVVHLSMIASIHRDFNSITHLCASTAKVRSLWMTLLIMLTSCGLKSCRGSVWPGTSITAVCGSTGMVWQLSSSWTVRPWNSSMSEPRYWHTKRGLD